MASALLKFTQGVAGPEGETYDNATIGDPVTAENSDNTGVDEWLFELVEVPPGSALVIGTASATDSLVFTPDVFGTYRVRLSVTPEGAGTIDIRNVIVRFPRRGFIMPPYQGFPAPLPLPQTGDPNAKPDEMNVGGQARGWMGDNTVPLWFQMIRLLDNLGMPLTSEVWVDPVAATATPVSLRNGSQSLPSLDCTTAVAQALLNSNDSIVHLPTGFGFDGETVDIGAVAITFACPKGDAFNAPSVNFTDSGTVRYTDCFVTGAITGASGLIIGVDSFFFVPFTCFTASLTSCVTTGACIITAEVGPFFTDCDIGGDINITGDVTCTILRSRFTDVVNITFTDPGTVVIDETTLRSFLAQGGTITNGTFSMLPSDGSVWVPYSPALTNVNVGSLGNADSVYRIIGDTCRTVHTLVFDGSGASLSELGIPLPALGLIVDETKIPNGLTLATTAARRGNDSGTVVNTGNMIARWDVDAPDTLTLDDGWPGGGDFLLFLPMRVVVQLDIPFKYATA